ncbi:MAG: heparinase II/III-family protein [Synergistaceae bacterium]|nr:heparinase II/III-family protein [Synergistaceae bacterium]
MDHRVITPYLNDHFWWMGSGDEPMCNWTPWCTQNVLLVAALTPQSDETRRMVCRQAVLSLDYFLKDYGDDGCCDEGAKYYGHAALCLFAAMEILNGMTGGHFAPLYKTEKIRNMADYIRQVHVAGDYCINFADCPPIINPPGALVYLFGKRTENPALSAFAAEGARRRGLYEPSENLSLYTRLTELFSTAEIEGCQAKPEAPEDRYFPSVGMLIARDNRFCLAVKTGDNDDNHNHNDTGSVTLYADGKPFLIDAGVGSYTRDTFSPRRYTIWTMQSAYHNLPTFAGIMQAHGADYRARDIHYSIGGRETSISMDIAGAYPKEAGVLRYRRDVRMKKGIGIRITDDYEGKHPAELSLLLCCRPVIFGHSVQVPGRGQIIIQGADAILSENIPITDPILLKAWPDVLFRLLITFSNKLEMAITPSE